MEYSKKGLALTESFEGCSLTAYQDGTGRWTIGYGHTPAQCGQVITPMQAEALLEADIAWAVSFVNKMVYTTQLTQGQFDALVDFTFNLGVGNFQHSTLLTLVNGRKFAEAAAEFGKWDKAGGRVVAGLLRRRIAEEEEFKSADSNNN